MIGILIFIMILTSAAAGFGKASWADISSAAASSSADAVTLAITLAGSMALWCGLMRIAERSGITKKISKLLSPVIRLIFGRLDDPSKDAVSLDLTACLLGLGNAATPAGIGAVKRLDKGSRPKRNTAMLTVLNTASIQIIPVTAAAIRSAHGSKAPFEILPAVLVTSLCSAAVGCIVTAVLYHGEE